MTELVHETNVYCNSMDSKYPFVAASPTRFVSFGHDANQVASSIQLKRTHAVITGTAFFDETKVFVFVCVSVFCFCVDRGARHCYCANCAIPQLRRNASNVCLALAS